MPSVSWLRHLLVASEGSVLFCFKLANGERVGRTAHTVFMPVWLPRDWGTCHSHWFHCLELNHRMPLSTRLGGPGTWSNRRPRKGRMGIWCPAFWNNPGRLPGAGNKIIKDSFQQSRKKWLYHERNVPREIHQTSEGLWHEHSVARSKAPWLSLVYTCKLEPLVSRNPLTGCARALKQGA